jgi:DsbC/DsbD-like thiol-disulfide interchange protein
VLSARLRVIFTVMLRRMTAALALSSLLVAGTTLAAPGAGRHVEATLVAATDAATPGKPLLAGLHLQMAPGWHTYWRNPGDSGLPTRVKWELPEGVSAGPLQWPRPIRFHTGPLVSYGYEDEVLLPVEIEVPAGLASPEVRLLARVSWLECQEVCLPGKAELVLSLPVRPSATPGPAAPLFEKARGQLPVAGAGWTFSVSAAPGALELAVVPPAGTTLDQAYFYPVTRRLLDYSALQTLRPSGSAYRIELPLAARGERPERLEGVLVGSTPKGPLAVAVDVGLAPP